MRGYRSAVLALGAAALLAACEHPSDLALPDAAQVASYYSYDGKLETEIRGNVAVLTVYQPTRQLRRGGKLWAKVGPYVFLFSRETQRLLDDFPGLAGVRVITKAAGGGQVAQALLRRDALNDLTWRRALHIAGKARRDGSKRPGLLEDLVRWGEDHTEFEYDSRYVSTR